MARKTTVTVYTVLYDGEGQGPAGDGTHTYRSGDKRQAMSWASSHTCYGKPAQVDVSQAPRRLAERWGLA